MSAITFGYHAKLTVPLKYNGHSEASRRALEALEPNFNTVFGGNGFTTKIGGSSGVQRGSGRSVSQITYTPKNAEEPEIIVTVDDIGVIHFLGLNNDREKIKGILEDFVYRETKDPGNNPEVKLEDDIEDERIMGSLIDTTDDLEVAGRALWDSYQASKK